MFAATTPLLARTIDCGKAHGQDFRVARLLVSVRSAGEAERAVAGGADIIDVKEPLLGSLGGADPAVWRAVREAVPADLPVSVALGELKEWLGHADNPRSIPPADAWRGIDYAKLGLADADPDWEALRTRLQSQLNLGRRSWGNSAWVSVIYRDWIEARAPEPSRILDASLGDPNCAGVLVDTWSKVSRSRFDPDGPWIAMADRIRSSGRFLAWAGGVDLAEIERIADTNLRPDIIAVRGAACSDDDRLGSVEESLVAELRKAVERV